MSDDDEYVLYSENDLRADLAALGLSGYAAARFLYRDRRVISRWLAGTQDTPPAIGMLLRLMLATAYTPEETKALLGESLEELTRWKRP